MSIRALLRITLLCAFFLTSTACGWVFVNGPPPNHESLPFFTCTQSKTWPILDVVWGGLVVLSGVSFLAMSDEEFARNNRSSDRVTTGVVGLAWGVASGFSARSGFNKVNECRAAYAGLAQRSVGDADALQQASDLSAPSWRPPQLPPVRSSFSMVPASFPSPQPRTLPVALRSYDLFIGTARIGAIRQPGKELSWQAPWMRGPL